MVHYNAHIGNGGGLLFLSENVPFKDMISNHTNKFSMTHLSKQYFVNIRETDVTDFQESKNKPLYKED